MPNVVFITADGLRAVESVSFIVGEPPAEIARLIVPKAYTVADLLKAAKSDEPMPTRKYRYAGKSRDSEMHTYKEIA